MWFSARSITSPRMRRRCMPDAAERRKSCTRQAGTFICSVERLFDLRPAANRRPTICGKDKFALDARHLGEDGPRQRRQPQGMWPMVLRALTRNGPTTVIAEFGPAHVKTSSSSTTRQQQQFEAGTERYGDVIGRRPKQFDFIIAQHTLAGWRSAGVPKAGIGLVVVLRFCTAHLNSTESAACIFRPRASLA